MYKPKHKKQMEIKPNGKVVGLAASAVMLATPILQSVSPALAANTDQEPAASDQNTTGTTSKDLVKDDVNYTYANLQTLIDTVTADTKATNSDGFAYPSLDALKTALDTATKASEGYTDATTATEIQGVYDPLNTAKAAYDADDTAYQSLSGAISDGNKAAAATGNTTDSVKALTDALTAATDIYKTADSSATFQEEAGKSVTAIQDAINGLTPETPTATLDTSKLETSLETAGNLGDLNSKLPTASALTDAIATANKTIANSEGLSQTDVDGQNTTLTNAITNYNNENTANEALQTAYTAAADKLKDGNNYTADSISAINTAVNNAKAAVDNATWTADQSAAYVTAANNGAEAIQSAVANAKVTTDTPDPTPDLNLDNLKASLATANGLGELVSGLPNTTALTRAVVAAQATVDANGTNTDQNGIDAQNTALGNATTAYQTELGAYNALQTAMVSGNAKLSDGNTYTTASTQAILSALAAANTNVLGATWKSAQSSDYIDAAGAATTAITTAVKNAEISTGTDTTVTAAKAVLQSALTTAKSYKSTDYTATSYQKLLDAIQTAQGVYLDPNATVAQVQAQTNNLSAVMGALDSTTNVGTVQGIKDLQTQAADLNPWDYTQASWTTLSNALDYAASVLAMDAPTKEQVDYAYTTLDAAISGLKEVGNNNVLKQLGDLYTQVNKLSSHDFTKSTWAKLVTAQTAAKTVLDGGFDASVSSVQAAYDDLQTAVKGLVSVNANSSQKTQLTDLYQNVEYYAQGSVPDETWAAFVTARDNASAALKSENSTVIDYMNAYDALNEAVANLGTDADMSYIASAAYNNIDGVGKVFFTDGQGIVLYDKPMGKQVSDSDGEGRILDNQSEWKVMRQATLQNGTSWYEVGKNQWVNASHMMIEQAQIGTIDYLPDMGVNLWAFEPDGLHFTGRRLDNGSAWEMWGSMMINGQQFFNLGANQWVSAEYITISDAE